MITDKQNTQANTNAALETLRETITQARMEALKIRDSAERHGKFARACGEVGKIAAFNHCLILINQLLIEETQS